MSPYEQYRAALERLPIVNPSDADIAVLCPHLPVALAKRVLFDEHRSLGCPPLRVDGRCQVISYAPHARRVNLSFPSSAKNGVALASDAAAFAAQHWGERLIHDTWTSVLMIYVDDPAQLNAHGFPKTQHVIFAALLQEYRDLLSDERVSSEAISASIADVTMHWISGREYGGDRSPRVARCCARCGDGLGICQCFGCGLLFTDDGVSSGTTHPLPQGFAELLVKQLGHVFARDPRLAQERERTAHAAQLRRMM